jgi:hypothetical protein
MSNRGRGSLNPLNTIALNTLRSFGFLMFYLVVTESDEAHAEELEKIAWCKEYQLDLTPEQCSVEAGW